MHINNLLLFPVHKTCEDSPDKGAQFVLEAAPQHRTSNYTYFLIRKASLDSVPNELKNGKS